MKPVQFAAIGVVALATLALAQRGGGGGGRDTAPPAPPAAAPQRPAPSAPATTPARPSVLDGDEPVDLPALYFRTSDYDGNGWISIVEARASMNLDRALFAVYDTDSDGRITQTEFTERYRTLVSRGGAFSPPVEKLAAHRAPRRTPEDLMAAFDQDRDGALDHHDVQRALTDYGAQGVDAEKILASLDADKSSRIELAEAQALLDVLAPPTKTEGRKKVTSIEALFDQPDPRSSSTDSPAQAPRLRGPLSTFRRLDFDHSGGVSIEDLEALQRPLLIPVRAAAVIATLDLDGDGEVSRRELAVAMR